MRTDDVVLGPLQETYPYYELPFCKPDHGIQTKKRPSGIGEILEGNELRNSGLKLHYPSKLLNDHSSLSALEHEV